MVTWHYICGSFSAGYQLASMWRTVGGAATSANRRARLAAGRGGMEHEAPSVLLHLNLGERVEVGNDFRQGALPAECGDAILQGFLGHQYQEAGEHVTADRFVEFMEDRIPDAVEVEIARFLEACSKYDQFIDLQRKDLFVHCCFAQQQDAEAFHAAVAGAALRSHFRMTG